MTSKLLALTVLFMAVAGGSQMAKAQSVDFSCPKAGTVEVRNAAWTVRSAGASADDPFVCHSDAYGKMGSLLFNFFEVDDQFKAETAREAFIALLSGHQKSVTFEFTNAERVLHRDTWSLLQHETLTLDGKSFDTIVFSVRRQNPQDKFGRKGDFTLWLDHKTGLWLKNEYRLLAGTTPGTLYYNYKDVSVTLPP